MTSGTATHALVIGVTDKYGCSASKSTGLIVESLDYGDLSSLPAAASSIVSGLKMGTAVTDADPPGRTNANASADDTNGTDDEDGVTYSPMIMGGNGLITVKVTNTTGSPAYINGWVDFNGNGSMDAGEQVVSDTVVATGAVGAKCGHHRGDSAGRVRGVCRESLPSDQHCHPWAKRHCR